MEQPQASPEPLPAKPLAPVDGPRCSDDASAAGLASEPPESAASSASAATAHPHAASALAASTPHNVRNGIAPVKAQYLKPANVSVLQAAAAVASVLAGSSAPLQGSDAMAIDDPFNDDASRDGVRAHDKQAKRAYDDDGESRSKRPKDDKKQKSDKSKTCKAYRQTKSCPFGDSCKFSHDISELEQDIPDIGPRCYVFDTYGYCPFGVSCRFRSTHISPSKDNIVDEDKWSRMKHVKETSTKNIAPKSLYYSLQRKKMPFPRTDAFLKRLKAQKKQSGEPEEADEPVEPGDGACQSEQGAEASVDADANELRVPDDGSEPAVESVDMESDRAIANVHAREKKKVDFSNKLYLAPLTTVGNLPFRRLCKEFGADITCSEMALAVNLNSGSTTEWALPKRHMSEDIFGVQICGSFPDQMARAAEVLSDNCDIDFIDINCGCPIDAVVRKGAGSSLLNRTPKLEGVVRGMVEVSSVPITIKMRTGYEEKNWNAHRLVPKLKAWGVSLITLHGRSRAQRYSRLADWKYINQCAQAASPIPVFGNGDVLSWEDAQEHRQNTKVSGLMIARGALIKPWIFTEIKENRTWDISSSERLDVLRKFTNYGLEHWGSDTRGVENTRRFLLEWMSFLCRYIPAGLLEVLPQRINERPPVFFGRDDLETLMVSTNSEDWIKISEMLLGPVPDDFVFSARHKSNSYSG